MKIVLTLFFCLVAYVSAMAAHQYNVKGNQGWLTFDGSTTVSFDLSRSGKDEGKTQENFIDRGGDYSDYGWYNLDTGASGSFKNGASATFSENDRIGLWVKDNAGSVYTSTKPPKKKTLLKTFSGENPGLLKAISPSSAATWVPTVPMNTMCSR